MLISLEGDVGSGKTLFATILALKDTRPIYANYKIKTKNYHEITPEILYSLNEPSLVILDEAYTWLESRTSGKDINRFMTYILFQSRKRKLDIVMTNQLISTVDLRYRFMINFDIQCALVGHPTKPIGFDYLIYKVSRLQYSRPSRIFIPYNIASRVFPFYDTYQKIDTIENDLLDKVSIDKTTFIEKIDIVRDELIAFYGSPRVITQGVVRNFCLRNQIPKHFVQPIYDAVKSVPEDASTEINKNKPIKTRKPFKL